MLPSIFEPISSSVRRGLQILLHRVMMRVTWCNCVEQCQAQTEGQQTSVWWKQLLLFSLCSYLFTQRKLLLLWGPDFSSFKQGLSSFSRVLQIQWENTHSTPLPKHLAPPRGLTSGSSFLSKSIDPLQIITELLIKPKLCLSHDLSLILSNRHTHTLHPHLIFPASIISNYKAQESLEA